ncbi:hypothetical protein ES703_58316 [subsurface metagenome]
MIVIARREIDVRPIIGAVVVFGIIGAAIFGVYYFLIAKPAAEELEQAKLSALDQINNSLASIGTDQASTATSSYSTQVQAAGSKIEVESISTNVTATIQLEQKRKELLDKVDTAINGTYYSTTGTSETIEAPALATLSETLKPEINAKEKISELEAYEAELNSQATSTWRTLHTNMIGGINENSEIERWKNSPASGGYLSKDNALAYVGGETWETLRKLKFKEASTVEVPILDTFQRTPTVTSDSIVNIYVYDIGTDNMDELWVNVKVRNVIYSQSDIATIAWALTDGITTQSYSVNIWETIKAAAAGDPEAAAVAWQDYGVDVMDRARSANIGDYDVSVIYIVEVPDEIGEKIIQYELHMTAIKDVILIATV